jgi:glutamate-1-semialdehyde 2,1-aminomutase
MEEKNYVKEYMKRTPGSRKLYERAAKVMPGGISHRARFIAPYPICMKNADGNKIWDVDGNEYIDLWMGHYALILGHKSKVSKDALKEVTDLGTHWGCLHEYEVKFGELLQEVVPCAERMLFGVSGTEATMYAVRLARGFTKRWVILKVVGGWHGGNSDLAWALHPPFEKPESAGIIPELGKYTKSIILNDMQATQKVIQEVKDDLAAVIIEPVVGGGGMIPADKEYLQMLRQETSKLGALLIFDEVITGFRLALGGAQEFYGIKPDLATMGKVCGGGANLGIVAGRADVLSLCDATIKRAKGENVMVGGGTFSCSPFTMVLGYKTVEYLKDHQHEIYPKINQMGQKIREGMTEIFKKNGIAGKTLGLGSLCGAYFPRDPKTVVKNTNQLEELTDMHKLEHDFRMRMYNHGVYVMHGVGAVSFAHGEREVQAILTAVDSVAREMKAEAH